jgi:hypothetical protein
MLVFVLVSEDNFGEGSTTTSVVNNVSHDTLDIPTTQVSGLFVKSRWIRLAARLDKMKLTQLFLRSRGF